MEVNHSESGTSSGVMPLAARVVISGLCHCGECPLTSRKLQQDGLMMVFEDASSTDAIPPSR